MFIYIHTTNLSTYNSLSPNGNKNVIKKIPITTSYGYLQSHFSVLDQDFLDVSKMTLKTIDFTLRDVYGNIVPLHGGHVSFSLLFSIGKDQ